MNYIKPKRSELKAGMKIEMRQCLVNYIKDDRGYVIDTVPWDNNIQEENIDGNWVSMTLTQEDLDGKHNRSFGHNDHFNVFMFPIRIKNEK